RTQCPKNYRSPDRTGTDKLKPQMKKRPQPIASFYSTFLPLFGGPAPNDEVTFRLAMNREIVGP
ncbi:MAG: hypothetical protein WAO17_17820, partial [Candidatus Sulfotelmatobacter sp.]